MCNSSWKNPNDLILVLRCTTLEFAKDLVNLGQIKFSTPKSWEQYGKQGRGDIYEGTLAYSSNMKSLLQSIPTPVLMNYQIEF